MNEKGLDDLDGWGGGGTSNDTTSDSLALASKKNDGADGEADGCVGSYYQIHINHSTFLL